MPTSDDEAALMSQALSAALARAQAAGDALTALCDEILKVAAAGQVPADSLQRMAGILIAHNVVTQRVDPAIADYLARRRAARLGAAIPGSRVRQ